MGDQMQGQRRLVVVVEVGPVHRHQDRPPIADLVRHPAGEAVPYIDAVVAQHPVDLLDRVFGDQAPGLRQGLADHRHRQRCRVHDAEARACQGRNLLGVQVSAIHAGYERGDLVVPAPPPIQPRHPAVPTFTRWSGYRIPPNRAWTLSSGNKGIRELSPPCKISRLSQTLMDL
jgi:hypothetical protein